MTARELIRYLQDLVDSVTIDHDTEVKVLNQMGEHEDISPEFFEVIETGDDEDSELVYYLLISSEI